MALAPEPFILGPLVCALEMVVAVTDAVTLALCIVALAADILLPHFLTGEKLRSADLKASSAVTPHVAVIHQGQGLLFLACLSFFASLVYVPLSFYNNTGIYSL